MVRTGQRSLAAATPLAFERSPFGAHRRARASTQIRHPAEARQIALPARGSETFGLRRRSYIRMATWALRWCRSRRGLRKLEDMRSPFGFRCPL